MKRRSLLSAAFGAIAASAAAAQTARPDLNAGASTTEPWPKAAFEATTVSEAQARLAIGNPQPGNAVLLDVPDISPVAQPIAVVIQTRLPAVDGIALLADRLPTPLIAWLQPAPQTFTRVRLTIHLPRTSVVRAIVRSQGQWYAVQREVKLALEPT
jgi:predicted secreted protein